MPATNEIIIFQGNNRTIEVTVTDADGNAFDLSGSVIAFDVKEFETDAASLIEKSSTDASEIAIIAPATNGVFEVYLVPADTSALNGRYVYDMTIVVGGKTYTIVKSSFTVTVVVNK